MAGFEFSRLATGRAAVNSARGAFTFNGTLTGYAPADFILGTPQTFTTPGPEVRGRVAEWRDGFFVQDKWQVIAQTDAELRPPLRTADGAVHHQRRRHRTECGPDGDRGRHARLPLHRPQPQRLGAARWASPTASPTRPCSEAAAGIYYNPNQTNSYTFLNTNPPYTTILPAPGHGRLDHAAHFVEPDRAGVCPTAATAGTIVTDPVASAHAAHEPVERRPGAAVVERRRPGGAVPRLALLSPGPQLLQQHAAPARTGRGQYAPSQSAVRRRSAPSTTTRSPITRA